MSIARAVKIALALFTVVSLAACGRGRDNPLLGDPMADVQVAGATRVERTVTNPTEGSFMSKPEQARIKQVYRTAGPGQPAKTVVEELIRRARANGWTFRPPIEGFAQAADKQLSGTTAVLVVGFRQSRPDYVFLSLRAQ